MTLVVIYTVIIITYFIVIVIITHRYQYRYYRYRYREHRHCCRYCCRFRYYYLNLHCDRCQNDRRGRVGALARSHMNGSLPFKRTKEQTTGTMPLAPNINCHTREPV